MRNAFIIKMLAKARERLFLFLFPPSISLTSFHAEFSIKPEMLQRFISNGIMWGRKSKEFFSPMNDFVSGLLDGKMFRKVGLTANPKVKKASIYVNIRSWEIFEVAE